MSDKVAVDFADTGVPARINYRVALPGAHTGKRIVKLDLGLSSEEDFLDGTTTANASFFEEVGALWSADDELDEIKAAKFFVSHLARNGFADDGRLLLAAMSGNARDLESKGMKAGTGPEVIDEIRRIGTMEAVLEKAAVTDRKLNDGTRQISVLQDFDLFLSALRRGLLLMPTRTWSGRRRLMPRSGSAPDGPITDAGGWHAHFDAIAEPHLFLVERYGISSFLGDYGMGRTVRTFTLLPGESTRISLKTWQSSKRSIEESSSIIDSHEEAARDRFADTIQRETTDRATREQTEEWHVEAEVGASWGWGQAEVSGGGSGEYTSGREQFTSDASEAVREHSAEASSKRELSVTSSSERTEETGMETTIERTIANVNKRRVLNFVFRELNQSYTTKLHLKEVRVAFTDGTPNSWREVPMSGLKPFLEKLIRTSKVDEVAQRILKIAGVIFDRDDAAVMTLERVEIAPDGSGIVVGPAALDADGEFPAPTNTSYYRFRRGPLAQDGEENPVDGVLLTQSEITMRTDSVIVEALLGQADALDEYAMELQEGAAHRETLANHREELLHETLRAVSDPDRRAELAAALFVPQAPVEED